MTLTNQNLETLLNMLSGLAQRQDAVRQLAGQLQSGTVWRSLDGQISVALSEGQRAQIQEFMKTYLDESDVFIASARAMLT